MIRISHRAGNDLEALRAALDAGADLVEADVHAYRGRLEVRHSKSLGPWWLWDRGGVFVRRRDSRHFEIGRLIAALDGDPRLMLDLKGIHPWLATKVAAVLRSHGPVTVCTQHWWMLRAFRDLPHVRLVLSAGSRRGLRRLRARLRVRPSYGVCVNRRLLTPELVTELRRGAEVVFTWPVDTAEELEDARRLGVDGVIGKDLDVLSAPPPAEPPLQGIALAGHTPY